MSCLSCFPRSSCLKLLSQNKRGKACTEEQYLLLDQLVKGRGRLPGTLFWSRGRKWNLAEIRNKSWESNSSTGLPEEVIYEQSELCACREQWDNKKEKRKAVLGHLGWSNSILPLFLSRVLILKHFHYFLRSNENQHTGTEELLH